MFTDKKYMSKGGIEMNEHELLEEMMDKALNELKREGMVFNKESEETFKLAYAYGLSDGMSKIMELTAMNVSKEVSNND